MSVFAKMAEEDEYEEQACMSYQERLIVIEPLNMWQIDIMCIWLYSNWYFFTNHFHLHVSRIHSLAFQI